MDLEAALDYAKTRGKGALVTLKVNGRPQVSNVMFTVDQDGLIRVSVTDSRAKTKNMRRDPRVSLHVAAADFWSYVVIEGDAELSAVASDAHDATVDELVGTFRAMAGEHSDWDEYRKSMVTDGRLVVRIHPTYAYGMLPAN